jgi:hypothetical protein
MIAKPQCLAEPFIQTLQQEPGSPLSLRLPLADGDAALARLSLNFLSFFRFSRLLRFFLAMTLLQGLSSKGR